MKITSRISFITCALICLATTAAAATLNVKVIEVQSGNTVVVTNINRPLKVRLKAIAPPEAEQAFSEAARDHLRLLVLDKAVSVEYTNLSEGYLEARVILNGIDIGSQMLRDGVAWYERSNSFQLSVAEQDLYSQCESAARNERRGLWSDPSSVAPWDFHREQLAKLNTSPPVAAPLRSTNMRSSARTSFSNADVFGSMFGSGSSAGAPSVRPIAANGSPDRWMTFESAPEHFSILVPSNSVEGSYTAPAGTSEIASFHFVTGGSPQVFCVFVSAKGPPLTFTDATVADETIRSLLAGMNEAAKRDGEYDRILTIKSGRDLRIDTLTGKQYVLHSETFSGTARVLTRKLAEAQELFIVFTLTRPGNESLSARFMNSFKLLRETRP